MNRTSLSDYQKTVQAKKLELGMIDTAASIEAMRNGGDARTPQKRAMLAAAEARARAAGREPIAAHY